MTLHGFDSTFVDFTDYIIKITEEIWEGRNVGAIHDYYAADCVVHTGMGSSTGIGPVISGTLEKQHQFPDREILGEDVIWSGTPETGLLSSHRSMMQQTHRGFGSLGPATGRTLQIRAIADCAAQSNKIYEEWLVVDQSAGALQAGLDPSELGRRWAQADAAAGLPLPGMAFTDNRNGPDTRELQDDPAAALVRDIQTAIWANHDLSALAKYYDNAVNLHLPGGVNAYGRDSYARFLFGYQASFPDAIFAIDHSIARTDPNRYTRVSTRWTLTGTHVGNGTFGAPSGAPMFILGITHSEILDGRIVREWVVIDEMPIWRRIGRKLG